MKNTVNNTTSLQYAEFITIRVAIALPTLEKGKKYYAKLIIGMDVWELLAKGEQLQVGEEMYEMVKRGLLPLTYAGKNSANWIEYWIN